MQTSTVSLPRKTAPAQPAPSVNTFAVASQRKALSEAIEGGAAALWHYARNYQDKTNARAEATYHNYRLLYLPGFKFAQGVVKVEDGTIYIHDTDHEGVCQCFCLACQGHVAEVNAALHSFRLTLRVTCKHDNIRHLLEREAREESWSL